MKQNNRKPKSIIVSCVLYFILYTLLVILIYSAFHFLVNQKINEAFFTLDDLLEYEEDLIDENYTHLPAKSARNAAFIIFDETGKTMYASNRTIGEKVFFKDMDLISDYQSGQLFDLFSYTDEEGAIRYRVCLSTYNEDGTIPFVLDECVLDETYRVVSGTLFSDREQLSKREFDLLSGISRNNGMLEKYVYENAQGEERTLAFLSFSMSEKQYDQILQSANRLWLIGIPVVLFAIFIFAVLFLRKVKQSIAPLNQTIVSYQNGKAGEIDPKAVPPEFHDMVRNFKELLCQLEKTRAEKDALYEEKQKMVVDISHDLKTPLTVIQGYAEALVQQRVPAEKQEKYLQTISSKSQLAADLVNDLFLFAQMEHPDFPLHLTRVDFIEYVKGFFAEKYTEITEAGYFLSVDFEETSAFAMIDARLMRRCFENLVSNFLKYNPRGTTAYLSMRRTGTQIELIVADDGTGIPSEIAAHLFEPFVTGNEARTAGKGTGLGLSIAKQIVKMHSGEMTLVAAPRKPYQTAFCIQIPTVK